MSRILFVSNSKSLIARSMKENLTVGEASLTEIPFTVDEISKQKTAAESIVLYCEEDMLEDLKTLVYLRDKVVEDGSLLFIVGGEDVIGELKKTIPTHHIHQIFHHPINAKEVAKSILDGTKNHDVIKKKSILVVDDSGAMLRNVKSWLEDKYRVTLANSGAMAIKYLSSNRPDLVLLDYEMPVVNGAQVLEMIRSETEFADVPVIFLTSKNDKESIIKVMALRPEGYLLKNRPPAEIVAEIDAFFDKQLKL